MGLVQKQQVFGNVRFKLDEPVRPVQPANPSSPTAPASNDEASDVLEKTGIKAVPDGQEGKEGLSLNEISALLKKKGRQ